MKENLNWSLKGILLVLVTLTCIQYTVAGFVTPDIPKMDPGRMHEEIRKDMEPDLPNIREMPSRPDTSSVRKSLNREQVDQEVEKLKENLEKHASPATENKTRIELNFSGSGRSKIRVSYSKDNNTDSNQTLEIDLNSSGKSHVEIKSDGDKLEYQVNSTKEGDVEIRTNSMDYKVNVTNSTGTENYSGAGQFTGLFSFVEGIFIEGLLNLLGVFGI